MRLNTSISKRSSSAFSWKVETQSSGTQEDITSNFVLGLQWLTSMRGYPTSHIQTALFYKDLPWNFFTTYLQEEATFIQVASTHLDSSVFQIASPVLSRGNYPVTLRLLHTQPLLNSNCNLPSNQGLPSDQYLLCKVRLLFNPHLFTENAHYVKVCFNDQETTNLRLCFFINFICDYHLHIFCFYHSDRVSQFVTLNFLNDFI